MTGSPGNPSPRDFGPFAGAIRGEIVAVGTASIHGDLYYDLTVRTDPVKNLGAKLRAPAHACRAEPRTGQRVRISTLMGQVTAVELDLDPLG